MIVGHNDPKPYLKMADKYGVKESLIFTGGVADPRPFPGAARLFHCSPPARIPSSILSVLEATAMGLPIITTRQNGASEFLENGKHGILVERGDSIALAAAMRRMLDADRRRRMAADVMELRPELSYELHVTRVEQLYAKVMQSRTGLVPTVGRGIARFAKLITSDQRHAII